MDALMRWKYYFCSLTVYHANTNTTITYDGYISDASKSAIHLSDVYDKSSIWQQKQLDGTYIFDYACIKSAVVYRMVRDTEGSQSKQILFVCNQ